MDFESIPQYEPLPGGSDAEGEGPGIDDDLPALKSHDLIGTPFAVVGFILLPSTYEEGKQFAVMQIVDKDGDNYKVTTGSKGLVKTLKHRWKENQLPFRTTIETYSTQRGRGYRFG